MSDFSRRKFIKNTSLAAAGVAIIPSIIGCSSKHSWKPVEFPIWPEKAPDGKPLKAGLVGCGARGLGAAFDFINAGNELSVIALGDIFPEQVENCKLKLGEKGHIVADENCFVGFDAYERVLACDIDVVLLCTPPNFRPLHFQAAIDAKKHIYMEKPSAVDPVGARKILASAKRLDSAGLCVSSGMIRRYQLDCVETWKQVAGGAIGEIISANVVRNSGNLWKRDRQQGWTDSEYMLRNWLNFAEVSGDMLVEQFVHEIDLVSWFTGKRPEKISANGGRHRRETGNIYDFFNIEFHYDDGMKASCSTRQIDGCSNAYSVMIYGSKGYTNCYGTIWDLEGNVIWQYPYPEKVDETQYWKVPDPFVATHVNLVNAIRTNKLVNDTELQVESTILAIMARMSAYTGKDVTWDEILTSNLDIALECSAFEDIEGFNENVPVPGI